MNDVRVRLREMFRNDDVDEFARLVTERAPVITLKIHHDDSAGRELSERFPEKAEVQISPRRIMPDESGSLDLIWQFA